MVDHDAQREQQTNENVDSLPLVEKQPYEKPRFKVYGRVERITMSLGSSGMDASKGASQMRV